MPVSATPVHSLELNDLSLRVRLGCSSEERAIPQEVRVSVKFKFAKPPQGATSDRIEDTICYATLADALKARCEGREFQLIEKLAAEFYTEARLISKDEALVSVRVFKVSPPIADLLSGAVYRIGDFE